MSTIFKNLLAVGFTEKEAQVYMAGLVKDTFTLSEISSASGVKRSTCYLIVEELVKREYLMKIPDQKISRFSVIDPKTACNNLQEKFSKTQSLLMSAGELRSKVIETPKIEVYKGCDGAKTVMLESLNEKPEFIESIHNHNFLVNYLGRDFVDFYIKKRCDYNIKKRSLAKKSTYDLENYGTDKKSIRNVRYLPETFAQNSLLHIWNDKVAFISEKKEGISFIITSKEFSALMKELFSFAWKFSSE